MAHFINYLVEHGLWSEVLSEFPRGQINALIARQVDEAIPLITDPEVRSDALTFSNMDYVAYIDRSLLSAGFVDEVARDELVSDLISKMLVSPGGLVSRWRRDAPLSYRFKRAVKNWIATMSERASRRRRRFRELPNDQTAREQPRDDDDLITDFRRWLKAQHGMPAVVVFNARLEGRDIKDLIGTAIGVPSSYALKRIVQQIKSAVVRWAGTDPAFQVKVRRLMDAEAATVAKRFGRERVGA